MKQLDFRKWGSFICRAAAEIRNDSSSVRSQRLEVGGGGRIVHPCCMRLAPQTQHEGATGGSGSSSGRSTRGFSLRSKVDHLPAPK